MALGKAAKKARNLNKIIQPKLDKKVLSDEVYNDMKEKSEGVSSERKVELKVYNHSYLNGAKKKPEEWLKWLDILRGVKSHV